MAESEYAGDYGGGVVLTCILDEGAPTVADRVYDIHGLYGAGFTFASELRKGDLVTLSSETAATYDACRGIPLVEGVSNGDDKVIGIIVTEPRIEKVPRATADGDTLAKRLAGRYYRIAGVELWGITNVREALLTSAGTAAVVPGVATGVKVDVSESVANHRLCIVDVANGGTGIIPLHYAASSAGAVSSVLVGLTGIGASIT